MGNELVVMQILRKVLKDKKISDTDLARLHRMYGGTVTFKEGQNRNSVASASRKLAKKKWDAPLDDIRAHKGNWAPVFGPETFSPEYSGWWAFSLAVLFGDEWWDAVGRVWIAANALAAIEPPSVIKLVTKGKESPSERRLSGQRKWRWGQAPFTQMPGPRFLWQDPLSKHTLIERSIAHPCLGLAAGRKVTITDWDHGNYGLPLRMLLGKKARRPESWGTVKLDREAVEHLEWLPPLPQGVWFRYQWFDDGTKIVAMSRGRANTRGTVPLSLSKGKTLTYYTAAQHSGRRDGSWVSCKTELDRDKKLWLVKSPVKDPVRVLEVKMPGEPVMEVVWDSGGAHVLGETPVPIPTPTPTPTPTPAPGGNKVTQALTLIDQAIRGAALEEQARTGAEVMRRILVGERKSAHQGAKSLERKLRGAPESAPAPGAEVKIQQALSLIDQVVPGTALEKQARTGAEVLKRVLMGNGPSAHQGAKTLVKKLA